LRRRAAACGALLGQPAHAWQSSATAVARTAAEAQGVRGTSSRCSDKCASSSASSGGGSAFSSGEVTSSTKLAGGEKEPLEYSLAGAGAGLAQVVGQASEHQQGAAALEEGMSAFGDVSSMCSGGGGAFSNPGARRRRVDKLLAADK
jgi:hypothetical protein